MIACVFISMAFVSLVEANHPHTFLGPGNTVDGGSLKEGFDLRKRFGGKGGKRTPPPKEQATPAAKEQAISCDLSVPSSCLCNGVFCEDGQWCVMNSICSYKEDQKCKVAYAKPCHQEEFKKLCPQTCKAKEQANEVGSNYKHAQEVGEEPIFAAYPACIDQTGLNVNKTPCTCDVVDCKENDRFCLIEEGKDGVCSDTNGRITAKRAAKMRECVACEKELRGKCDLEKSKITCKCFSRYSGENCVDSFYE